MSSERRRLLISVGVLLLAVMATAIWRHPSRVPATNPSEPAAGRAAAFDFRSDATDPRADPPLPEPARVQVEASERAPGTGDRLEKLGDPRLTHPLPEGWTVIADPDRPQEIRCGAIRLLSPSYLLVPTRPEAGWYFLEPMTSRGEGPGELLRAADRTLREQLAAMEALSAGLMELAETCESGGDVLLTKTETERHESGENDRRGERGEGNRGEHPDRGNPQ